MFMVVMKNIHLKLIKKDILQHHIANEYKNSLFEGFTPATDIRDRGKSFHLDKGDGEISFGIYAASPVDHSFTAQFSEMEVGECKWQPWSAEDTGFKQTANK